MFILLRRGKTQLTGTANLRVNIANVVLVEHHLYSIWWLCAQLAELLNHPDDHCWRNVLVRMRGLPVGGACQSAMMGERAVHIKPDARTRPADICSEVQEDRAFPSQSVSQKACLKTVQPLGVVTLTERTYLVASYRYGAYRYLPGMVRWA